MGYENNIELIQKSQAGDKEALNKTMELNLKLVSSIAKKFLNRGYEYEDIFQIGCMGLLKAIKKFDTKFETKFSTYAVPMIIGEIKRFIRDDGMIKVSRSLKKMAQELHYARLELADKLGKEPTNDELAEYTGYILEEVTEALNSINQCRSFEEVIHKGDSDITLGSNIQSDFDLEETVMKNLEIQQLRSCIEKLPPKQRDVVNLRLENKTQVEISKMLGISQVEVSRSEKRAHKKLKEMLGGYVEMSKREESFDLFKEGHSNEEIANRLGIKLSSVEVYRRDYRKRFNEPKIASSKREESFKLFAKNMEPKEVSEILGIALSTAHSYKNEYNISFNTEIPVEENVVERDAAISAEEIVQNKEAEAPKTRKYLRPKLFEGEVMDYEVAGNNVKILSKDSKVELLASKDRIDILIRELQELREVI